MSPRRTRSQRIDLSDHMTAAAVDDLARQLRRTNTPVSHRLAKELEAARRREGGTVVLAAASLERMIVALPKKLTLRHLRKTLGSILAESDRRAKAAREAEREPDATLLSNQAATRRKHRARQRSGPFYPD